MTESAPPPTGPSVGTGYVRRVWAPDLVVAAPGCAPVHLLLITEWLDSISVHLAWAWLAGDVHSSLRQAYRLSDCADRGLPLIDSRVMPLAGRMNEVTYFDTRGVVGAQTLALRLRSQLATPIPVAYDG